ncbi:hypothetical protein MRB53_041479 [Persea americana]|nr:hypothetical protein MRB53_041479 [Persea americana]
MCVPMSCSETRLTAGGANGSHGAMRIARRAWGCSSGQIHITFMGCHAGGRACMQRRASCSRSCLRCADTASISRLLWGGERGLISEPCARMVGRRLSEL